MDHRRSLLETFKYLSAKDILMRISLVCKTWTELASQHELWHGLLEASHISPQHCPREAYRRKKTAKLVLITSDSVRVWKEVWKAKVILRQKVMISWNSAYAFVDHRRIILCGNQAASLHKNSYLIDYFTGAVQELCSMKEARVGHGVISVFSTVYVFGGYGPLNTGEKFDLSSGNWTALPAMSTGHAWFTPCQTIGDVYICGGGTFVCEKFVVATEQFFVLDFVLPEIGNSLYGVAKTGVLLVLQSRHVSVVNVLEGRVDAIEDEHRGDTWAASAPVVSDMMMKVMKGQDKKIVVFDLKQIAERSRVIEQALK